VGWFRGFKNRGSCRGKKMGGSMQSEGELKEEWFRIRQGLLIPLGGGACGVEKIPGFKVTAKNHAIVKRITEREKGHPVTEEGG